MSVLLSCKYIIIRGYFIFIEERGGREEGLFKKNLCLQSFPVIRREEERDKWENLRTHTSV